MHCNILKYKHNLQISCRLDEDKSCLIFAQCVVYIMLTSLTHCAPVSKKHNYISLTPPCLITSSHKLEWITFKKATRTRFMWSGNRWGQKTTTTSKVIVLKLPLITALEIVLAYVMILFLFHMLRSQKEYSYNNIW